MTSLSTDVVKWLTFERHLTLREAAHYLGTNVSQVCNVRKGKPGYNLRLEHLLTLEERLNVPLPVILLKVNKPAGSKMHERYIKLAIKLL